MKIQNALPLTVFALSVLFTAPVWSQNNREGLLDATRDARLKSRTAPSYESSAQSSSSRYLSRREARAAEERRRRENVEEARGIKAAMKRAVADLPSPGGKKEEISTGITDGTWLTRRSEKIYGPREHDEPLYGDPDRDKKGLMEKFGAAVSSLKNGEDEYIEKRYSSYRRSRDEGREEKSGFNPLQPLEVIPNAVGGVGRGIKNAADGVTSGDEQSVAVVEEPPQPAPAPARQPSALGYFEAQPVNYSNAQPPQPEPETQEKTGPFSGLVGRAKSEGESELEAVEEMEEEAGQKSGGRFGFFSRNSSSPEPTETVGTEGLGPLPSHDKPSKPLFANFGSNLPKISLGNDNGGGFGGGGSGTGSLSTDVTLYTVSARDNAQFYPYSGSAGSVPLPAGTVVRMDKEGDEWSAVEVPGTGKGIVRTKELRRAMAHEVSGSMLAGSSSPEPASPVASTRSSSSSSSSSSSASSSSRNRARYYSAPREVQLPDLPNRPKKEMELGGGLLPPLPQN